MWGQWARESSSRDQATTAAQTKNHRWPFGGGWQFFSSYPFRHQSSIFSCSSSLSSASVAGFSSPGGQSQLWLWRTWAIKNTRMEDGGCRPWSKKGWSDRSLGRWSSWPPKFFQLLKFWNYFIKKLEKILFKFYSHIFLENPLVCIERIHMLQQGNGVFIPNNEDKICGPSQSTTTPTLDGKQNNQVNYFSNNNFYNFK